VPCQRNIKNGDLEHKRKPHRRDDICTRHSHDCEINKIIITSHHNRESDWQYDDDNSIGGRNENVMKGSPRVVVVMRLRAIRFLPYAIIVLLRRRHSSSSFSILPTRRIISIWSESVVLNLAPARNGFLFP